MYVDNLLLIHRHRKTHMFACNFVRLWTCLRPELFEIYHRHRRHLVGGTPVLADVDIMLVCRFCCPNIYRYPHQAAMKLCAWTLLCLYNLILYCNILYFILFIHIYTYPYIAFYTNIGASAQHAMLGSLVRESNGEERARLSSGSAANSSTTDSHITVNTVLNWKRLEVQELQFCPPDGAWAILCSWCSRSLSIRPGAM